MTVSDSEIRGKLRDFISNNFLIGKSTAPPADGDSFLESGLIDSTGVLEVVGFVQDTWEFDISDEDMLPENLDSIDNLTAYVLRRLAR
ncbi:MAG: acyl carrier protein [Deltaproteobacteria bacterium]|nr:acyl carrier protein [Deltaproteobacteria bacterium]